VTVNATPLLSISDPSGGDAAPPGATPFASHSLPASACRPLAIRSRSIGETAYERAYKALKAAVHSSTFQSGEVLTLRRLTTLLGFGAMPVREAVKRLISEGAFEGLPNRSARVPILSPREIQQLAELRLSLEPDAAAQAARNMTLHQLDDLQRMYDAMLTCVAARDFQGYKNRDTAFHFEIYRIADNKPLASLIDALWLRMAPFISRWIHAMAADPAAFDQIANRHHEVLLTAFRNRDPEAARAALRNDLACLAKTPQYFDALDS
jgi:DNA-binding GntR family transcriptional regulator